MKVTETLQNSTDALWSFKPGKSIGGISDATDNQFYLEQYYYIAPNSAIKNLEMDLNQVVDATNVNIYAFQCDGANKPGSYDWDYGTGTGAYPAGTAWAHTALDCSQAMTQGVWHHFQIEYASNGLTGAAQRTTYIGFAIDGSPTYLNITTSVPTQFALHWSPVGILVPNFQQDGNGTTTMYLAGTVLYGQQCLNGIPSWSNCSQ